MNKHLQQVKEFRARFGWPTAEDHLSEMQIVLRQAWLMDAGKQFLLALQRGDMADILARLTALAYLALHAIARAGGEVESQPVVWRHDGSVASLMRLIGEKINACGSGRAQDYAALYCTAAQLASAFLNADFDKAFDAFHAYQLQVGNACSHDGQAEIDCGKVPDLSDCLYE